MLQVLQSAAPGAWSLKMPSHALHLDALLSVFPDARLVWAHRDPFRATASALGMYQMSRARLCGPDVDRAPLIAANLRQLAAHVERPLRTRERIGDARFFHLHYADLLRDPIGQMRALYDWAGDDLTADVERAMRDWLVDNPQDRFGVRPYSLDAYGLTVAELEPLYAEYLSTFAIELEAV